MAKLIKKIMIFLLPVLAVYIFPIVVYFVGREYYTAAEVVAWQKSHHNALFGLAYSNSLQAQYKIVVLQAARPELVVLGASRSLSFRKEFFNSATPFVNGACAGYGSVGILNDFLKNKTVSRKTKVIIISLDPKEFYQTDNQAKLTVIDKIFQPLTEKLNSGHANIFISNIFGIGWRKPYYDYFARKFTFKKLFNLSKNSDNIGLSAMINGSGFRYDGSYNPQDKLNDPNRPESLKLAINNELLSISPDKNYFEYGEVMLNPVFESLADNLKFAKDNGIEVVGFLPPRPSSVYKKMISSDYIYQQQVLDFPKKINKVFTDNDFSFYDFSNINILHGVDSEFYDASHVNDKYALRMTIYMAEHNKKLGRYVNIDELKKMLADNKGDYLNQLR